MAYVITVWEGHRPTWERHAREVRERLADRYQTSESDDTPHLQEPPSGPIGDLIRVLLRRWPDLGEPGSSIATRAWIASRRLSRSAAVSDPSIAWPSSCSSATCRPLAARSRRRGDPSATRTVQSASRLAGSSATCEPMSGGSRPIWTRLTKGPEAPFLTTLPPRGGVWHKSLAGFAPEGDRSH